MFNRTTAIVLSLLAWHVILVAVVYLFSTPFGYLYHSFFQRFVAEVVQANYGLYELSSYVSGFAAMTSPATIASLITLDWSLGSYPSRKHRLGACLLWEALVVILLFAAYEQGLDQYYRSWDWNFFGPPDSPYSFRNFLLPRILAVLTVTVPLGGLILWNYSRLPREA